MSPADPFSPVAILGPGLIGGSLGLALKRRNPDTEIRVWGRRDRSFEAIRRLEFASRISTDLAEIVTGARCVVLCTPVEIMPDLSRAILPQLERDAVVTDAGSVKGVVVNACESILGSRFVGAHPIAGSDRNGIEAASADLFEGATCVLTPSPKTDDAALVTTRALWEAVGCHLLEMSAATHDSALARTSHLPHVAASALAAAVARVVPGWEKLAGGGYRDATRVAQGSPDLWTGIFLANRKELSTSVAEFAEILQNFRAALDSGDADAIRALLSEGHDARKNFDAL